MHRMLAGAAADFEHARAVGKVRAQHGEDRIAVALAGGREGFFVHRASVPDCARARERRRARYA